LVILDNYYSEYIGYLKKNRDEIREALIIPPDSKRAVLYSKIFNENYYAMPEPIQPRALISATDGSEFVRELYNGKKIILTRAFTICGREEFLSTRIYIKAVNRYSLQNYVTRNMEIQEHLSVTKCISSKNVDIALLDGSAGGRLGDKN